MRTKQDHKKYNATIRGRYRQLRRSAKDRALKLLISMEEYLYLMDEASCFYCEEPIDLSKGSGHCLDRINNSKSYYLNNVVVCCNKCNWIKSNRFNFEEAIFVIRALKAFRQKFVKRN